MNRIARTVGVNEWRPSTPGNQIRAVLGQFPSLRPQVSYQDIKIAESFVLRLALHIAKVNLLNHYGDFEPCKCFIKNDLGQIAARRFLVSLDNLFTRQPAGPFVIARNELLVSLPLHGPVSEKQSNIDQRVADRRHLPVKNCHHASRLLFIKHHVVELEIVVNNRRAFTVVRWKFASSSH